MKNKAQNKQPTEKEEVKQKSSKIETVKEGASTPETKTKKILTLGMLKKQIDLISESVVDHGLRIEDLQKIIFQKRKPTQNSKIQIRDKQTGKVYPSKNNCYQSLLKSGNLKDMVGMGILGPTPEKNTFGWYTLVKALPNRFEEVISEQVEGKA